MFVMAGDAGNISHVAALVTHAEVSPGMLDAIGRLGNPLVWSFLLHFLADRELGEAAERALLTLLDRSYPRA